MAVVTLVMLARHAAKLDQTTALHTILVLVSKLVRLVLHALAVLYSLLVIPVQSSVVLTTWTQQIKPFRVLLEQQQVMQCPVLPIVLKDSCALPILQGRVPALLSKITLEDVPELLVAVVTLAMLARHAAKAAVVQQLATLTPVAHTLR